eukprot:10073023-Ditylum_brightwellii.AAC.1
MYHLTYLDTRRPDRSVITSISKLPVLPCASIFLATSPGHSADNLALVFLQHVILCYGKTISKKRR